MLWIDLEVQRRAEGMLLGCLGAWGSLGVPWASLGFPRGPLYVSFEVLGRPQASWERPGKPLERFS